MSAQTIQVDYEQMEKIVQAFSAQAELVLHLKKRALAAADCLTSGGWTGQGAQAFFREMDNEILPALDRLAGALDASAQEAARVAQLFLQAEEEAAGLSSSQGQASIFFPILPRFPSTIDAGADLGARFEERWKNMSLEERKQYFQQCYDRLVAEYGLTPRPINYPDLEDKTLWGFTIGDSKGRYNGAEIAIDIDNLKSSNGRDTLDTLLHETRHQIQHKLIEDYQNLGESMVLPRGVTLDQVRSWADNWDNYRAPEDGFKDYWNQPIEVDARKFGEDSLDSFMRLLAPQNLQDPILVGGGLMA